MKVIYIEFHHAPHIVCVVDEGKKTYYKKVIIKGPSSVVSVEQKNGIGQKQAWVEVEDTVEIEGIDPKETNNKQNAVSNFYRAGADSYFKKHLKHLIGVPNLRFLEIGSYAGSSAVGTIEDILTDKSSTITCVDVWYSPFIEKAFDKAIAPYSEQIIKHQSFSKKWLESNQDKEYDFIYIDGDHSADEVKSDMELSWNILKPNGIMAIDDYNYAHPKGEDFNPKGVIDDFIKFENPQVLEITEQVWIKKQ